MKGFNMTNKHTFGTAHVPLSPAIRAGDFVFVSGQVPVDTDGAVVSGGIGPETDQVIANITKVLALADCTLSDIVKTTVWLRNRDDFAAFNAAYAQYFPSSPPTRSTAESRLMIDIAVEIEAVAYKPI
jgi:2-iminobutanoate/2-iminopropanoate deaminase